MSDQEKQYSDIQGALDKLQKLEMEFETADVEILRFSTAKHAPLLAQRDVATSSIPSFWSRVLEQSADEADLKEHITSDDFEVLCALTALSVTRPNAEKGDPRDLAIKFVLSDNPYTPAQTLVKHFYFRSENAMGGDTGLVSEPVAVQWKEGKDLTGGINAAAIEAFEERRARGAKKAEQGPKGKRLDELMENDSHSSFFNWFSYSGPHKEFGEVPDSEADGETDIDAADLFAGMLDPFPWGDGVAIAIAEDIYPNAVKYFTAAVEEEEAGEDDSEEEIDLTSDVEKELMKAAMQKKEKKSKRAGEAEGEEPKKKKAKKSE